MDKGIIDSFTMHNQPLREADDSNDSNIRYYAWSRITGLGEDKPEWKIVKVHDVNGDGSEIKRTFPNGFMGYIFKWTERENYNYL